MTRQPSSPASRILDRACPEAGTVTLAEWRRLTAQGPAPLPTPSAGLVCPACWTEFHPHPTAAGPRFCSPACRRWWHYGPGHRRRRAVAG